MTPEQLDALVPWLRAQLDEDEREARAVEEEHWREDVAEDFHMNEFDEAVRAHVLRHDPARIRREVEAKRRILDLHRPGSFPDCRGCGDDYPCETAKLLALPYSDRPGYREEWRP